MSLNIKNMPKLTLNHCHQKKDDCLVKKAAKFVYKFAECTCQNTQQILIILAQLQ